MVEGTARHGGGPWWLPAYRREGSETCSMTHTPGPWFVGFSPDMDGESGEYGPGVYDSEAGVFAVIDGEPETVAQPYLEADARLIAAAPEMLEALEAMVEMVEMNGLDKRYALDLAASAIRKVRGEK